MRRSVAVAAVLALLTTPGWAQQAAPAQVPVGVMAAALQPVTQGVGFVGRVEARERVDVKARITGYVENVLFKDGQMVKEGDPLYLIEPAPFQAALDQAKGAVLQAQATLTNASLQRARAEELVKTNSTPIATRDERVAQEKNAQGALLRAQADLKTAEINLGYTNIVAPITGRIGRSAVTKGNVVSPNSGTLALVVSEDPMYVTFPVSQRELLSAQEKERQLNTDALVVKLTFADGKPYPQDGRVDFIDVTVDRATDTVLARATVPNPNRVLIDGQYVNVRVQGEAPAERLVVPQAALIADQAGVYVFVVEDGKAAIRRIKTDGVVGANMVVESGLKPGDEVIVEGLQNVRAGTPVLAQPVRPVGQDG
jgi:membrane fusion protein, multidrug efflux system